jgi:hypothetical protein
VIAGAPNRLVVSKPIGAQQRHSKQASHVVAIYPALEVVVQFSKPALP